MNKERRINILRIAAIGLLLCNFVSCSKQADDFVSIGDIYFAQQKYDLALENYNKALADGVYEKSLFNNLGIIYQFEKKDYSKAEEIYKKGISIFPIDSSLHYNLSQLFFSVGKLKNALDEYKLAIRYKKGDRLYTVNTNRIKGILKDDGKSESEINDYLKEVLKINPADYFVLFELAEYEKNHKNYNDALVNYKNLLKVRPEFKPAYNGLATCYYNLGNKEKSLEYFQKAKEAGYYVPDEFFIKLKKELSKSAQ